MAEIICNFSKTAGWAQQLDGAAETAKDMALTETHGKHKFVPEVLRGVLDGDADVAGDSPP